MKTAYFIKSILKNTLLCLAACWLLHFVAGGYYLWTPSFIEKISVFTELSFGDEKTEVSEQDEKTIKEFVKTIKLKEHGFSPCPYAEIELIMPISRAVLIPCSGELYVKLSPWPGDYYMPYSLFKADCDGEKLAEIESIAEKYRK